VRSLGIDFGTKKVGLALSNEDGTMAFPHEVFSNDEELLERILNLIEEKRVTTIVIGESRNLKNEPNQLQTAIDAFIDQLVQHTDVSVVLEPEQFTTQAATRIQGKSEHTDASAAALILDSYIIKHQHDKT